MLIDHLRANSPKFDKTLESLQTLTEYFSSEPGPIRYDYVRWAEQAGLAHEVTLGDGPLGRRVRSGADLSHTEERAVKLVLYATIYDTVRGPGLIRNYRWTSKQVISEYFDALLYALDKGQLLSLFCSARSIIEKVSNIHLSQIELEKIVQGQKATEDEISDAVDVLSAVSAQVGTGSKQTRVNWKVLEQGASIRKKKVSKPESQVGVEEYEQVNILRAVDKLGKEVFGLRSVYEYLCEFVHPNYGHTFLHLNEDRYKTIRHNLIYRTRISDRAEPEHSWRALAAMTSDVLDVVEETLQVAKEIDRKFLALEESQLRLAKKYIKFCLKKQPYIFGKSDPCPCASGEKIRDCCGQKLRRSLLADS